MAVKTLRRGAERMQQSINDKVRGGTVNKVCVYWLSGRCTRNPCRFLHSESPTSKPPKQSQYCHSNTWHRSSNNSVKNSSTSHRGGSGTESKIARKTQSTCVNVVNILGEVGSLICEDPWVFVGLTNAVKAWNIQTQAELNLTGPVGQVYAMVAYKGVLFAGTQEFSALEVRTAIRDCGGNKDPVSSLCTSTPDVNAVVPPIRSKACAICGPSLPYQTMSQSIPSIDVSSGGDYSHDPFETCWNVGKAADSDNKGKSFGMLSLFL
ncbi:hypothetical protein Acr_04g0007100 [Actinidia rufa]|uniref:C3H1-type domain-containing protein n=1 Tax=Actinidia rufa TaxID=165716 RepID=A0A7J0EI57_9ERIC|nr:hypothetical protein Acr_04g0007100 [Actinidia rufa]